MKARAQVMRALQKTVGGWAVSQKAAAERLGITQPRLNDLLRGKIDKFSLDTLFDLTGRAGLKVSLSRRRNTGSIEFTAVEGRIRVRGDSGFGV
jgi:predicted XRE-type DNA-binding protein